LDGAGNCVLRRVVSQSEINAIGGRVSLRQPEAFRIYRRAQMHGFGEVGASLKAYRVGTHRGRSPDDTIAKVMPLAAEFGITRVANLTGLDRTGIPVITVCRPNARSSAVFHGKGIDLTAAKVSGIMETIETWHAEHVQLPLRFASFTELVKQGKTADIHRLPGIRASWFDVDAPLLWVEGRNLMDGEAVWTPYRRNKPQEFA
jgi:ribosomal protein S12 methylthiotransferase accessory factor YcaO